MKNAFAGKPITRVLVIAAVIVLVLILFGSMYIVHQNEYGIVWQFGAVNTVRQALHGARFLRPLAHQ